MFSSQIKVCDDSTQRVTPTPAKPSLLKGSDECGVLVDKHGNVRRKKKSSICFVWFTVILVVSILRLVSVIYLLVQPRHDLLEILNISKFSFMTSVVITIIVSIISPYIMYFHCVRCNGWAGAVKIMFISTVLVLFDGYVAYATVEKGKRDAFEIDYGDYDESLDVEENCAVHID